MENILILDTTNEKDGLYQWDLDQRFIVTNPEIDEVHYYSSQKEGVLRCLVYTESDTRYANIPNIILQKSGHFRAYVCSGDNTITQYQFTILPKPKPDDYVYTETEVYRIEEVIEEKLLEAKESGEFDGAPGEKGEPGPQGPQGPQGEPGQNGKDGATPQKGVDYFTPDDINSLSTKFVARVKSPSGTRAYVEKIDGTTSTVRLSNSDASGYTLAQRDANGNIPVGDAVNPLDAVNKQTLDNIIGDIESALNELHEYAQGFSLRGDAE